MLSRGLSGADRGGYARGPDRHARGPGGTGERRRTCAWPGQAKRVQADMRMAQVDMRASQAEPAGAGGHAHGPGRRGKRGRTCAWPWQNRRAREESGRSPTSPLGQSGRSPPSPLGQSGRSPTDPRVGRFVGDSPYIVRRFSQSSPQTRFSGRSAGIGEDDLPEIAHGADHWEIRRKHRPTDLDRADNGWDPPPVAAADSTPLCRNRARAPARARASRAGAILPRVVCLSAPTPRAPPRAPPRTVPRTVPLGTACMRRLGARRERSFEAGGALSVAITDLSPAPARFVRMPTSQRPV